MPYVNIWIHAVWSTKYRERILLPGPLHIICEHIRENAREKSIFIDELNGYRDHLHCLMALRSGWSIAKQMQMIKGEASHWINDKGIFKHKFEWADGYFAASVSESRLGWVRNYIRFQEQHHRRMSFEEEYAGFLENFRRSQG